jgi:hypothetical protein
MRKNSLLWVEKNFERDFHSDVHSVFLFSLELLHISDLVIVTTSNDDQV